MRIPKVTVGMPVFNRANVLRDTIQQVLDQTFTDFEFIIYNDGSTDDSAAIVRSISDERIIFLDKPNLGPPHPLNGILEIARGEYIIILHDHDFFDPTLLEKSVNALSKYPGAGFVLQGSAWIDEDGISDYREMLLELPELNNGGKVGKELLLNKKSYSSFFHACCMVRHSAYEAVGKYYKNEFGLYADTDLWFRLLARFDFVYLSEILFKFRTRESGHFLNDKGFEVLSWNNSIHLINIQNQFKEEPILESAMANLNRKFNHYTVQLTLAYGSRYNLPLFRKGLSQISLDKRQSMLKRGVSKILLTSRLDLTVSAIMHIMNKARQKI